MAGGKKQVFAFGKGNGLTCFAIAEKASGIAKLILLKNDAP